MGSFLGALADADSSDPSEPHAGAHADAHSGAHADGDAHAGAHADAHAGAHADTDIADPYRLQLELIQRINELDLRLDHTNMVLDRSVHRINQLENFIRRSFNVQLEEWSGPPPP